MQQDGFDVVVIGAGPGGYVAAIRAAQLGLRTAIVESEERLGGTCLRVGCIPSKALLESSEKYAETQRELQDHGIIAGDVQLDLAKMLERKDTVVQTLTKGVAGLMKKNSITRYHGHGRLLGSGLIEVQGTDAAKLTTRNIIIATGSKPASLPGVDLDYDRIGTSTEALSYPEVPKRLLVIGAGYIGLELGSVWARLGADVTIVEYLNRVLPGMDAELAKEAHKQFQKQGLKFQLGSKVTRGRVEDGECTLNIEGGEPLKADRVLVCVGRTPNTHNLGLEALNIIPDKRGRIAVDDRFRTTADGVYAIGDVIRGPMLAHKAEEEGVACAEFIATGYGHVNYDAIPSVVYTHPEVASVGQTEDELKESGTPYRKGSFPFSANGRAQALGITAGRVKVLSHAETDRVLGVHIIGPRAGDLIAECAVAIEFGASSEDIGRCCHAHPTLAECVKEAALGVEERSLHV